MRSRAHSFDSWLRRAYDSQQRTQGRYKGSYTHKAATHRTSKGHFLTDIIGYDRLKLYTSSSAIAERPRDARVTSIRKIAKWNF